jgi:hypothetical protein
MEREIFKKMYPTPYFFSAEVMRDYRLEMVELQNIYRQKDMEYVSLLNKIRDNSVNGHDIDALNQRYIDKTDVPDTGKKFDITLTTTNAKADEINDGRLEALQGQELVSVAKIEGDFGKEYFPTAPKLAYKIGAQIMLLNNDSKKRWVNGSIGVVESRERDDEDKEFLRVRLSDTQKIVRVYPHPWEVFKFKSENGKIVSEPAGSFTQYPFRLAWAVTIHKSQGKTFDHVTIDMGRGSFAAGQTYVALSRCTSFEGIRLLTPIQKRDIRTDDRINDFMHGMNEAANNPHTNIIRDAIANDKELKITYMKSGDEKSERILRPITLQTEELNGNYYFALKAFCKTTDEYRMFNAARIVDVEVVE